MSHSACTVPLNSGLHHSTDTDTEADALFPKMSPGSGQGGVMIPTEHTRKTTGRKVGGLVCNTHLVTEPGLQIQAPQGCALQATASFYTRHWCPLLYQV